MLKGWLPFTIGCAAVCGLMLLPPDIARWIAVGLLVVVVLTPAVDYKSRRSAAKPRSERGH